MSVTSSVTVEFKIQCDVAGEPLSVELDTELNMNRTCFLYGEKVYFRVYHSPALIITVIPSDGSVFLESVGSSSSEKENISFADTNEASVGKALDVLSSYSWFGRSLGSIVKTGWTSIRSALSGVAVAAIAYTTSYDVYSLVLSDKGIESYPVLVLVKGDA
jgi:hypothetical protein